jgi:hypothetical protein
MVAIRRYASRWGAYAALGIALAISGQGLSNPISRDQRPQSASFPSEKPPTNNPQPSDAAMIHGDVKRIGAALEAANVYAQNPAQQKQARDTLKAQQDAAGAARALVYAALFETAVTAVGVLLVFFTLREARKSASEAKRAADEAKRGADETKRAADASITEFEATHRPRLHLRRISNIAIVANHPVVAHLDFANIGDSEARITEVGIDIFYRAGPSQASVFNAVPQSRLETVPPGKQASIQVMGGRPLTANQAQTVQTGNGELCLLVVANYLDRQNIQRSVGAFRIFRRGRRRFVHVPDDDEFAELEYED